MNDMTPAEALNYGKHWNGSVVFDGRPPNRRTEYVPRHADNGNCYHWWPETRFAPPTITVNFDGWGRKTLNPRTVIDDSKPAPFRMLAREPWEVPSQKGFKPGSVAQFKYPIDEYWAGDSAKYAEFVLLERWDFPGVTGEVDSVAAVKNGAQIAWRVKWIRQHYSNGVEGHATGAEFRIPEWRLQPIMLVLDCATGKVGRLLGDEKKGKVLGTKIPDYLRPDNEFTEFEGQRIWGGWSGS